LKNQLVRIVNSYFCQSYELCLSIVKIKHSFICLNSCICLTSYPISWIFCITNKSLKILYRWIREWSKK
jgi:hypothetical protein